jgi:hypothetical protein
MNERNISQADGEDGSEAIQEIPCQQKREESAIHMSTEGALQYDEKCVTLLPKVGIRA